MKHFLTSLPIAIGLSLLYTGVVYAQTGEPPADTMQGGEIAAKLAGLVAAATLIERLLEMFWDTYESSLLNASKLVVNAGDYLDWAKKQVKTARDAFLDLGSGPKDIEDAENALKNAEKRLSDYLQSAVYVSWKKKINMPAALVLGLIIAFLIKLRIFVLLGILSASPDPNKIDFIAFADIFITGLIIATGSAPVHSLIGILQKTKDTVDAARALYSGQAITQALEVAKSLKAAESTPNVVPAAPDSNRNNEAGAVPPVEVNNIELERTARRLVGL